jgi:hypothetical protein
VTRIGYTLSVALGSAAQRRSCSSRGKTASRSPHKINVGTLENEEKRYSTLSELALLIVKKDRRGTPEAISDAGLQRERQS